MRPLFQTQNWSLWYIVAWISKLRGLEKFLLILLIQKTTYTLIKLAWSQLIVHVGGSSVRLNDGPDIKLYNLVGWAWSFFTCCLAHRGSTVGFILLQWRWSTPRLSPGVGRNNLFLSSPRLCFITVFICDLFDSRDDQWWVRKPSHGPDN